VTIELNVVDTESDFGTGRRIKETGSICPVCTQAVNADVYERHGQVWMDKCCVEHGEYSALLSSGIRHYYEARHYFEDQVEMKQSQSCCGSSCSLPAVNPQADSQAESQAGTQAQSLAWANHSCNVLIEIIERCNLTCPTCFAGSSPQHSNAMSIEDFTRQVDNLVAGGKSGSDVIQLSGGEPTIHPDLFTMIGILIERGFLNICINTNGIKLAQRKFAEKLASCTENNDCTLYAYLQFDGFEKSIYAALRGRDDLHEVKRRALENCHDLGISVHPVMTLTKAINDHEVGEFINLAVEYPDIKNVVIQPAMYSGRYDNPRRVDRLTLEETIGLVCDQSEIFSTGDFTPIPCSDPNCFSFAVAMRSTNGLTPISRYFPPYRDWGSDGNRDMLARMSDTINGPEAIGEIINWAVSGDQLSALDDTEVDRLLESVIEWQSQADRPFAQAMWDSLLTVSIKPFMDAYTYDQDRIDQCCVHILDPDGQPVSFCEYNAVNRPRATSLKLVS
jgi:uncharacterized radical SAM superfamily Fe-S cluster-containing enzyme